MVTLRLQQTRPSSIPTKIPHSFTMADEINPRMLGEWLAGMSLPERARNLNRISYDLTVCAREFEAATQPLKGKRLTNTPGRSIRKSKPWLIGVSTCSEG